ncbi:hypothetical protein [Arthrobacter sp. A2-55]|uniref:hypothetical protein n=1 Tax=Arthrobacter sp. A2-55 TaxID=2897337 RepID=UPI0021CDBE0C|nr:hypothetical protein [Arthrobacter sp. A2-55]MCU6481282.1 hypothetical protein [Arthrobacter sp. A2-55]
MDPQKTDLTATTTTATPAPAATRQAPSLNGVNAGIPDLPTWVPEDYHSFIAGSGAEKLADSGVAPLVAAARGYQRIDHTNFADEAKTMGVKLTTGQGRRWKQSLGKPGKDAMQMPWYSVASIQISERRNSELVPLAYQLRPEFPDLDKSGKPMKYEFVAGAVTPLDLHPGTPIDWIDTTPVVMFAEGMLKGDSALSAYLHANGASWDELRCDGDEDPRAKLRALMDRIPAADRVLVISIAGIYNAHQHPIDWREIDLKDRIGWIAFDADLAINPSVHLAAQKLFLQLDEKSKMSKILFLNPEVNSDDGGGMAKAGVDDYLAKAGTWDQLVNQLTTKMPDAPVRNAEDRAGNWRISKDGLSAEECVPVNNGPGGTVGGYNWEYRLDLGGRIMSLEAVRQPTDQELRTGLFDPDVAPYDVDETQVEIEVSWKGGDHNHSAIVTGPENILNYMPADWVRQGATIPRELLLHPSWPPRAQKGESWLAAVKGHRSEEVVFKTRWMRMGWVPVDKEDPVFLVGDQIIGDSDLGGTAVCGVDERRVPMAQHFGVGDLVDGDYTEAGYRDMIRADFRAVLDAYIGSQAWTEEATAAIVLATALRPTIPLRPRTSVYLWGSKGSGKSWSAQAMMYFWARHKDDWQGELPGQAKDTAAAIENALSYTPIWVIDDLAPSSMRHQSEAEDAKLSDMTRAVFNNAGKHRMNADMTSRRTRRPMTQLVMTAENELVTPSVKERLIPVNVGPGKLNPDRTPTDRINELAREEGLQARFTSHMIRYIRHAAAHTPGRWESYVERLEEIRRQVRKSAEIIMKETGATGGSLERITSLAADTLLTFEVLKMMAQDLGMDNAFVEQFGIEGLGHGIVELVNNTHTENRQSAPGASLIRALSALLASGGAHVISGDDPSRPPIEGTESGESLANHRLGWGAGGSDGSLRPAGMSIGTVITQKDETGVPRKVILFDLNTAFSKAQAAYPNLIPYGQGAASGWGGAWDEGLAADFVKRTLNKHGKPLKTARRRIGSGSVSGVPIEVETILNGGKETEPTASMAEAEQPLAA